MSSSDSNSNRTSLTHAATSPAVALELKPPYYTSVSLLNRYAWDVVAATGAAFCVSPFITIIDKAITQNASGAAPLGESIRNSVKLLATRPLSFLVRPEFRMIWGLYTATYVTANTIDTTCEWMETSSAAPKFMGVTAVNMSLCILKDRAFARMFGVIAPSALPAMSYGLFAVRDSMTIGASFSLPPIVSKALKDYGVISSDSTATTTAQLVCPAAIQILSTPLHLYALDLYNNKGSAITFANRMATVSSQYVKSLLARVGRIGPAFGVGGVANKYLRDSFRDGSFK